MSQNRFLGNGGYIGLGLGDEKLYLCVAGGGIEIPVVKLSTVLKMLTLVLKELSNYGKAYSDVFDKLDKEQK